MGQSGSSWVRAGYSERVRGDGECFKIAEGLGLEGWQGRW